VGIENGGVLRIDEYGPWVNPQYGGGEGALYSQFLVETLKPYIDNNYRTLPDRQNTAIAGSSLGALISLYAALSYPEVYSRVGLFSPAFWFNPEIFAFAQNQSADYTQRFYFTAGSNESATMVSNMQTVYNALLDAGHSENNLFLTDHPDGAHSEWFWAREFIPAMEFLFECQANSMQELSSRLTLVYPNPANDSAYIQALDVPYSWSLWNMFGQELLKGKSESIQSPVKIDLTTLVSGQYLLLLQDEQGKTQRTLFIRQ
jgi:pimeloyl-ACP methyl ester carboxylesterase